MTDKKAVTRSVAHKPTAKPIIPQASPKQDPRFPPGHVKVQNVNKIDRLDRAKPMSPKPIDPAPYPSFPKLPRSSPASVRAITQREARGNSWADDFNDVWEEISPIDQAEIYFSLSAKYTKKPDKEMAKLIKEKSFFPEEVSKVKIKSVIPYGMQVVIKSNGDATVSPVTPANTYFSVSKDNIDLRFIPLGSDVGGDLKPGLRALITLKKQPLYITVPLGDIPVPVHVADYKIQADVNKRSGQKFTYGGRMVVETTNEVFEYEIPITIELVGGGRVTLKIPKILRRR